MALTPEDVVNKRFQLTRLREGYDQDQVDDFLDEVVVEFRRLNQENEEMRQRLIAADSRIAELQRSGGQTSAEAEAPAAAPAEAPVADAIPVPAEAAPAASGFSSPGMDEAGSTDILQLARRLHEEHVRDGVEKRDALIAEGHATAARVVGEAEAQQREQIGSLEQEKATLETKVDELRTFEREYRQKLKSYIQDQLNELESNAPVNTGATATTSFGEAPQESSASEHTPPVSTDTPGGFAAPGGITPPPASYQGFGGN